MKLNLIKHSIVQSLSVICLLLGTNSYANHTNGTTTFHCPDGTYDVTTDTTTHISTFTDENGIMWKTSDGAVAAEGNINFSQYAFISADTDFSNLGVTCVVQFNYADNTLIQPVEDPYKHAMAYSGTFTNGECKDSYTECIFQTQP